MCSSDLLVRELQFEDIDLYYWSDSETILGYISNEVKRFHTFVLNRVERIRESTTPEQWHYVSTSVNPADIASRGSSIEQLPSSWFEGPDFLSDPSYQMVNQPCKHYPVQEKDPEVKRVFAHRIEVEEKMNLSEHSKKSRSWRRITNIVRYVLKFGSRALKHTEISEEKVLKAILKMLQMTYYSQEIEKLKEAPPFAKTSVLFKLDPFIDSENIIRVGGRLKDALSAYKVKHPAVMPAHDHITKIYALDMHKRTGHQGRTTTMNHIRTDGIFLGGQGNRMLSSMIFRCVPCIKIRGKPQVPKMADLPSERVEETSPFTHSGMDVFGPFYCKDGRKQVKRYGLIFSCLSTRAVHLEMLQDMSTDSFINSLRCFLALRGSVESLLCDRGTNFVGAKNELQKALEIIEDVTLQQFLKDKQCAFKLNVPSASHMSGAWERMIRTIRNVMSGILHEQASTRLDSAALRTLMYECMSIVNSRPLTTTQLTQGSSIEPVPLTPNMMLTMKSGHPTSPGHFSESDLYSRKQWRRIQYLAEQFWSRWRTEYLQQLQSRQKWSQDRSRGVKLNDIVMMMDDDSPRSSWKIARVIETYPGRDGRVRKVKLKLSIGSDLERPVHKLIVLVPSDTGSTMKN